MDDSLRQAVTIGDSLQDITIPVPLSIILVI